MEEKKFVLDYSKWRSGYNSKEVMVGIGRTELLNDEGFMCCLGQWALQEGATREMIKRKGEPESVCVGDDEGKFFDYDTNPDSPLSNFDFCSKAIKINDDQVTTPIEKIDQLKSLCAENSITLEVINIPE